MVEKQPVHAVKRNISNYCNIPKELNRFSFRFFHQPHLQIIYLHDVQKLQGGGRVPDYWKLCEQTGRECTYPRKGGRLKRWHR